MASRQNNSFPVESSVPTKPNDTNDLKHAPASKSLKRATKHFCTVKVLRIGVSKTAAVKSFVAYLHLPQNYRRDETEKQEKTAVILMSGASGGVAGPSSIYVSMADKIASLRRGIPVLRMDYRVPAMKKECVIDVLAAMDYLQKGFGVSRFVLIGWSFGGVPVTTVGGMDERIVGCAVVASQSAGTEGIERMAARSLPLLLLHGTADQTLGAECSERLFEVYRKIAREDMGFLKLFEGDNHALTGNSRKAEAMLCAFVMRCAGVEVGEEEDSVVLRRCLVGEERVKLMEMAGDLGEGESWR
jgi:alpha/beta superfamily hydrolase